MRLTNQQLALLCEQYLIATEGSDKSAAIRIQAEKAGVNLKYINRSGIDPSFVANVFKAANAQNKMDMLLGVIQADGIRLDLLNEGISTIIRKPIDLGNKILYLKITKGISYIQTSPSLNNRLFKLVEGIIVNPEPRPQRAIIKVSVRGTSDTITIPLVVPPPSIAIPNIRLPQFTDDEGSKFTKTLASTSLSVELYIPGETFPIDKWESRVLITQPDIGLIVRKNKEGNYEDFTADLASWVNSGAQGLADFLTQILPISVRQNLGYPNKNSLTKENVEVGDIEYVDNQVRAVYEGLLKKPFTYMPTEFISDSSETVILQRIRPPEKVLADPVRRANCLDATILMASMLEYMGLSPLLFILPRHAILGWKRQNLPLEELLQSDSLWRCGFLDVILSSSNINYYTAVSSGEGYFIKSLPLLKKRSGDLTEFARLVDVKAARDFVFSS
jgi:hypothetical protein